MSILPIAFLMGFLGSLHCAVMCGPIVLGLPLKHSGNWYAFGQVFFYQLGRVIAYCFLGLLIGIIGSSIKFYAKQETLSAIIGFVMVFFAIAQLSGIYLKRMQSLQMKLLTPISKLMGKVFKLPFWPFLAGFLNGLIPCGMIYLALATALNLGTIADACTFMLLFGLGTAPLMFLISLGGIYLKKYLRFNTAKLIPWFMLLLGLIFVFRSYNLAVPFLSPVKYHQYGVGTFCGM